MSKEYWVSEMSKTIREMRKTTPKEITFGDIDMPESPTTSAIDEIFSVLDGFEKPEEKAPEPVPVPETKLEGTDWVTREDGCRVKQVPYSELIGMPSSVPDHLVPVFEGYNGVPERKAGYVMPKAEFELLSYCIANKLKVNTVGPTGCGKTLMYEEYAAITGRPYLRIEHNNELDKAEVFGQTHLNIDEDGKQSTDFIPGVFVKSAYAPTICNLDELTRAPSYANMIYQLPLDRGRIFLPQMKEAGEMEITPDEYWVICASDNTKGNGDDLELYSASNVQDAAFLNRWDVVIEAAYLSTDSEKELFSLLCPSAPDTVVSSLATFSDLIHKGVAKGDIQTAFSPRNLEVIAKLVNGGMPIGQALHVNYISRVSKSEVSDIEETRRAAFGHEHKYK